MTSLQDATCTPDYIANTIIRKGKLKYIEGNGLYDVGTPNKTIIKITDENGKNYSTEKAPAKNTALPAGKEYTAEVRAADGRYNGAVTKKFRVLGMDVTKASDVTVSNIKDQAYTGSAITPEVTVSNNLKENVDYTVAYFNNVNVGTAKVVVTFIKNYSGTITKYFEIVGSAGTLQFADAAQKALLESGVAVGTEDMALNIVPSAADDTLKLSYTSDNTDVVTVTEAGVLSFKGAGTATVTVTGTSSKTSYAPLKVTVVVKEDGAPTEELKASCTPSRLKKVKNSFTVTTNTVKGAEKWIIRYSLKNLNKTTKGSAKATFKDVNKVKRQVVKVNKSGAKYYVQCRVVKDGVKSAWSKVKTVKSR